VLALLIITGLLIAGLLLALTFVRINLAYSREGEDDRLTVRVSWLGLSLFRADVPVLDLRAAAGAKPAVRLQSRSGISAAAGRRTRELLLPDLFLRGYSTYRSLRAGVFYLTPRLRIEGVDWRTRIGTGSADQTGVLTGVAWAVKGSLLTLAARFTDFRARPRLAVEPEFGRPVFATAIRCILAIRLSHIIIAGLKCLPPYQRGKSGGAAPHPGPDADRHGEH